jgi:tetratricopeptide (TPR) repeat protein
MPKSTLLAVFVLVITFSCKQNEKPLTAAEVKAFATKIEASVGRRESGFLDEAIDRKKLLSRAHIPNEGNSGDFKRGLNKGMNIGSTLIAALNHKSTYQLVKQYQKQDTFHLVFRLYTDGSLNYHDFELTRTDGEPRIADLFIYTTGENLSQTLHSLYVQFSAKMKDESYFSANDEWLQKLPDIRQLMSAGKYREASGLFNKIPADVQKGRTFQILHVEIGSGLTNDEYSAAIEEYKRLFPNEPNMQLLLLDGYVLHKEYDKALNAVNELDKQINKDPLLDYFRYLIYVLLENKPSAKESLERLVKNMPEFEAGNYELIRTYLDENEFEKARPLIEKFRNKSSYDQSSLQTLLLMHPDYQ